MKKALIDINIILDFLNKRDDHLSAAAIIDLCVKRKLKGYVCSHEITTLSYFLEKHKYPKDRRIRILTTLLDTFSVISISEKILRNALSSSTPDYEDAVIIEASYIENIDFIVTRNLDDFKKSSITVFNASEAVAFLTSIKPEA